ncbi:MAG TPA: hypothetical protein VKD90_24700 [Gemmataceae bacterium]|nr:hypothetical protein [Gemmataceae bacterium]
MKKWLIAAAVAAGLAAGTDARAQAPATPAAPSYAQGAGSCPNGDCSGQGGYGGGKFSHISGAGKFWTHPAWGTGRMPTLPVYMAAPWYLYWPYDGHFQTVAPMAHGLYYPPPSFTGNPFLPGYYPGYVPHNPVPTFPAWPARP